MVTANQIEAAAVAESDRKYSVLIEGDWLECDVSHGVKWTHGNRRVTHSEANTLLRKRPALRMWAA